MKHSRDMEYAAQNQWVGSPREIQYIGLILSFSTIYEYIFHLFPWGFKIISTWLVVNFV